MKIIKYLKKKLNLITGYRYWYRIKFVYKTKDLKQVFSFFSSVGLVEKNTILYERNLKKDVSVRLKGMKIDKLLCNGIFSIEDVNYLGHFKSE